MSDTDNEFNLRNDTVIRPGLERRMQNLSNGIVFTRFWSEEFWTQLSLLLQHDIGFCRNGVRYYGWELNYKRPLVKRLQAYVTMLARTARKLGSASLADFTALMIKLDRRPLLDQFPKDEADSIVNTLRTATDRLWADNEIADIADPETFYPPVPQEFYNEDENDEGDPDLATMRSLEEAEKLYKIRAKDFLPQKNFNDQYTYPLRTLKEWVDELTSRLSNQKRPLRISFPTEDLRLLRSVLRTNTQIWYEVYRYADEGEKIYDAEYGDELVRRSECVPTEEDHDRGELIKSIRAFLTAALARKNNPSKENRMLWSQAKTLFDAHHGEFHGYSSEPSKEDEKDLEEFIRLVKTASRQLRDLQSLGIPPKGASRTRGRKGSGLRGTRTSCMEQQFTDFLGFLISHPISEIGQGRTVAARARQFWAEHNKTFDNAKRAQGEKRGYANANAIASAYRTSKT